MIFILSLAMLCQAPDIKSARLDLEFTGAVESFVASASPMATPPAPYRGLIDRQGGNCYQCREAATRRLQRLVGADPGAIRWLFWGRRHPDPEVRIRSNAILRRLNPCLTCNGTAQSKNWSEWPCWECEGTGTAWPYTMWD